MPAVVINSIKQAVPIVSPATVLINFTVTGILPDKVQVYAGGVSGELAILKEEVDMTPPENTYTTSIVLAGGSFFRLHLCPRTTTDGVPDDKIDEQFFEAFCTQLDFTTQAPPNGTRKPKPPPPTFQTLEPHQATLQRDGGIMVRWVATTNFDQYHLIFEEKNGRSDEFEIDSSGTSGFFDLQPAFPGRQYSFKVQGCITHTLGLNDCSEFTMFNVIVMPPNTHSLKEFLRLSGVHLKPGLRSLGAEVFSSGIRAMMKL